MRLGIAVRTSRQNDPIECTGAPRTSATFGIPTRMFRHFVDLGGPPAYRACILMVKKEAAGLPAYGPASFGEAEPQATFPD